MNEYFIREVVYDPRKPRLICVCGGFDRGAPTEVEWDMDFVRCQNCRGWMSGQRLVEIEYEHNRIGKG